MTWHFPFRLLVTQMVDKQGVVTMQELLVSSLAQTDALTKLLIEKGLITEPEFMQKLSSERASNQAALKNLRARWTRQFRNVSVRWW